MLAIGEVLLELRLLSLKLCQLQLGHLPNVGVYTRYCRLGEEIEGYLRASEISRDRVEDARTLLNAGDEVEAKFMGVDKKNRSINLSIKAKDNADEKAAVDDFNRAAGPATTTLGDILKEQMEGNE